MATFRKLLHESKWKSKVWQRMGRGRAKEMWADLG